MKKTCLISLGSAFAIAFNSVAFAQAPPPVAQRSLLVLDKIEHVALVVARGTIDRTGAPPTPSIWFEECAASTVAPTSSVHDGFPLYKVELNESSCLRISPFSLPDQGDWVERFDRQLKSNVADHDLNSTILHGLNLTAIFAGTALTSNALLGKPYLANRLATGWLGVGLLVGTVLQLIFFPTDPDVGTVISVDDVIKSDPRLGTMRPKEVMEAIKSVIARTLYDLEGA